MVEREVRLVLNVDDSDLSNTSKKTDGVAKSVSNISKSSNDAKASLKALGDGLGKAVGAPIPGMKVLINTLGGVAKSFRGIGVAIAASGIGLLITILAGVTAAFTRSEEGQNKFAKAMAVIGSVLDNLLDALAFLGSALISAIEEPGKAWDNFVSALKKGVKFAEDQVFTRFKAAFTILTKGFEAGILKMRIAWNNFTGDSEEADKLTAKLGEVQAEIVKAGDEIQRVNQAIVDGFNAATEAVKGLINETLREAKIAAEIADRKAKADILDRNLIVARARTELKVNELRFKAEQRDKFSLKERIAFLEEAQRAQDAITLSEKASVALRLKNIKEQNALSLSNKDALNKEAELKAKLIEIDAKLLNSQRELERKKNALKNEENAEIEAKIAADEKRRADELERKKKEQEENEALRLKFLEEDEEAEIEFLTRDLKANAEAEAKKLQLAEDFKNAKIKIEDNLIDILGKNTKASKLLQARQAVANTFTGATEVFRAKTTVPEPLGTILKISNAALIVKSGLSAVKNILASDKGTPSLSGGGTSAPATAPTLPPAFNIVGDNQGNQIANSLSAKPVKAFVVSKDVSSGQELDRNIIQAASFG